MAIDLARDWAGANSERIICYDPAVPDSIYTYDELGKIVLREWNRDLVIPPVKEVDSFAKRMPALMWWGAVYAPEKKEQQKKAGALLKKDEPIRFATRPSIVDKRIDPKAPVKVRHISMVDIEKRKAMEDLLKKYKHNPLKSGSGLNL